MGTPAAGRGASRAGSVRLTVPLVAAAGLLGVAVAFALNIPAAPQVEPVVRVLADTAGATVLGLAALPRLQPKPITHWRLLAVTAGIWWVCELAVLACAAATVVDVPLNRLSANQFGTYLTDISGGQLGIAILVGVAAIACYAAFAYRTSDLGTVDLVLVVAAVALALRPVTGHMSQQPFGSVLAAAHALAAAAWLGLLIAATLVVRSRGEWATVLPRYSNLALPLVGVVAVSGLINGVVRVGGPVEFATTGYGRILLGKTLLLLCLLGLGWWWRRTWVRRAADHRVTAADSLRRAIIEVVVMTVVFGLAATLAVSA